MPNSAQMLGNLRAQKASPQVDVVIMDVSVSKAGNRRKAVRQDRRETSPRMSPTFIPLRALQMSTAWRSRSTTLFFSTTRIR